MKRNITFGSNGNLVKSILELRKNNSQLLGGSNGE